MSYVKTQNAEIEISNTAGTSYANVFPQKTTFYNNSYILPMQTLVFKVSEGENRCQFLKSSEKDVSFNFSMSAKSTSIQLFIVTQYHQTSVPRKNPLTDLILLG